MSRRHLRLGILTAAWGRPALTEHVLRHYSAMSLPGVELVRVVVMSPEDPAPATVPDDWTVVFAANEPLSNKWNAGALSLSSRGIDAMMIVGSDDMVSASYVYLVAQRFMRRDTDFASARVLHVDYPGDSHVYRLDRCITGAGRVLSARLLEAMRWQPWEGGINVLLDSSLAARLRHLEPVKHYTLMSDQQTRWAIVDVKQPGENMWQIEHDDGQYYLSRGVDRLALSSCIRVPADQFYKDHFAGNRYEDQGQ